MSQENVQLVGRCVSSWIRGDFDPEEFLAEDIEWHAAPEEPEAGRPVLRGRESVYQAVTAWFEQLGPSDIEVTELLDCGSDVSSVRGCAWQAPWRGTPATTCTRSPRTRRGASGPSFTAIKPSKQPGCRSRRCRRRTLRSFADASKRGRGAPHEAKLSGSGRLSPALSRERGTESA
jgi:hypothetical protein